VMLGMIDRGEQYTRASALRCETLDGRSDRELEDVVAEEYAHVVPADEVPCQGERVGDARRTLLERVIEMPQPEGAAVAQEGEELTRMIAAGDDQDPIDPSLDEQLDRVVDHRLVVHRQKVLVRDACQRIAA